MRPHFRYAPGVAVGRWLQRIGVGGFCLALLAACTSPPTKRPPPVPPHQAVLNGDHYIVQRGDTLYSIAFRLDRDYKALARINDIAPPYRIFAGQRLSLVAPHPPVPVPSRPAGGAVPGRPAPPAVSSVVVTPLPPMPPPLALPGTAAPPAATAKAPPSPPSPPSPLVYDSAGSNGEDRVSWRWPLKGALEREFQEGGNKGIDIAAREGEAVAVAAGGKVVYSGQGLIGYGNLIIVKHSDTYLSAYGNNGRLLVQEGDEVAAGQSIAEAGAIGGRPPALHFEIRRAGKPVNPLDYLPRR